LKARSRFDVQQVLYVRVEAQPVALEVQAAARVVVKGSTAQQVIEAAC
jgi:hypothetical protein